MDWARMQLQRCGAHRPAEHQPRRSPNEVVGVQGPPEAGPVQAGETRPAVTQCSLTVDRPLPFPSSFFVKSLGRAFSASPSPQAVCAPDPEIGRALGPGRMLRVTIVPRGKSRQCLQGGVTRLQGPHKQEWTEIPNPSFVF